MIYATEAKIASRAKTLGESASAGGFAELQTYCVSESPLVRRIAASAIGKLAGVVNEKRVLGHGYTSLQGRYVPQARPLYASGKKLVSLYPSDLANLDAILGAKLEALKITK